MLVIEPDVLIRQLLCEWLAEAGYAVEVQSPSGQRSAVAPDLVILDVPRVAGFQGAESLGEGNTAPVLAISARFRRGLGSSAATARRLGVHRVLPKPFTREELLEAVAESLQRPR